MTEEKKQTGLLLFGVTILIGIGYQYIPALLPFGSVIGTIWNALLCGLIGYYLLKDRFTEQFKHFSWKTLAWGLPLTLFVGILCGVLYQQFFGEATKNSVADVISLQMIFLQVPFMLMGEELLSTNLILGLEKAGMSFHWASLICSVLFALWHIPAYGFHIAQLLITLLPLRLVLNYIWKKSESIWVSWICHFLYDCLGFVQFFMK
ncbi:CPBP family intramembrane metalloprotease [Enterococcus sp. BWM-S5]|uniref:CPBP family intramembrane metalloprotease n=1 Tax=Enterococcus larvae TaxID=2794352 RepID=A0ABS4CJJ1_9ENTE|nr:CPBP family intramembrane glutamic endopeptidase [Enterococcus larvae]MBP1046102.1 CPBP family intramembrane metalloprotease [Enterococcus larvae]